ncbi:hypothetical protein EDC96DRAFT_451963 [Choanephora cucurbitarum]|nr:hypothetical protein EDC96DRAFT_451963 [Choanephora cucurbitarum]
MRSIHMSYSYAWIQVSAIVIGTIIGSLFYMVKQIGSSIESVKLKAESACDIVDATAIQLYNMPQLQLESAIQSIYTTKENIHQTLIVITSSVEKCIVWLSSFYKSMYRCLLGVAIHTVLELVKQVIGPVQTVASGIASFFHVEGASTDNLQWFQALNDVQGKIDQWFQKDNGLLEQVVHKPFSLLQSQINSTIGSWNPPPFHLNQIERNVSAQFLLKQPCNTDELVHSLDYAYHNLAKHIYILVGVLFGLLLVCGIANLTVVRLRHRQVMQARTTFLKLATELPEKGHSLVSLLDEYTWNTSYLSPFVSWETYNKPVYRILSVLMHPGSLCCLFVAISGILMVHLLCWLLVARSEEAFTAFNDQAHQWALGMTSEWSINANNQINEINEWINQTEYHLNNNMLSVIQGSAGALNGTLNHVVHQIGELISNILGGTVLETSAKQLAQCLVVEKIENIEAGLTWIADVTFVHLGRINSSKADTSLFEEKMTKAIDNHMEATATQSFGVTNSLDHLMIFYYMLLAVWCSHTCISLVFHFRKKK